MRYLKALGTCLLELALWLFLGFIVLLLGTFLYESLYEEEEPVVSEVYL